MSNRDDIVRLIGAHASSRCFALGLGNSASHDLVESIARAGKGSCAFVGDGERPEPKVL